jgi:hypothetical protein
MHVDPRCAFHRDLDVTLGDFQRAFVLSIFPGGSEVSKSEYFDNYDLPCPIRVEVQSRDGRRETVVLRSPSRGSVEAEADLLRFLGRSGLPVPRVLAGPTPKPSGGSMILLSLLPGIDWLYKVGFRAPSGARLPHDPEEGDRSPRVARRRSRVSGACPGPAIRFDRADDGTAARLSGATTAQFR